MADRGTTLLTGTVRRWTDGGIAVLARGWPNAEAYACRSEERFALDHIHDPGDQPDTECLVIIADDPAELRRVREMLEGGG